MHWGDIDYNWIGKKQITIWRKNSFLQDKRKFKRMKPRYSVMWFFFLCTIHLAPLQSVVIHSLKDFYVLFFFKEASSCILSHAWLFCYPMDCNLPTSLSLKFSNQKYWSGLPFPSLGGLPDPRVEPTSPVSPSFGRWFFPDNF